MTRIAIATLQSGWDCRWARPGNTLGESEMPGAQTRLICNREGTDRRVEPIACQTCPFWELSPDSRKREGLH